MPGESGFTTFCPPLMDLVREITHGVSLYKAIPLEEEVKSGVYKKVGAGDKRVRIAWKVKLLL